MSFYGKLGSSSAIALAHNVYVLTLKSSYRPVFDLYKVSLTNSEKIDELGAKLEVGGRKEGEASYNPNRKNNFQIKRTQISRSCRAC
jgi:hypothetical protein